MSRLNNGFFGSLPNTEIEFGDGDYEPKFNENLLSQPLDWYYRTNKITYKYNSFGHRCKDIQDIDLDNYILFAGCSHVEGTGLELENTYPYLVAEELGCDYYNLAQGGTGIDVLTHNLIMWKSIVTKPPKFLVVHQPEITRFVTLEADEQTVVKNTVWDNNKNVLKFIDQGSSINFFLSRFLINMVLIEQLYDSSTIIRVDWDCPAHPKSIHFSQFDKARDLGHAGIQSNKKLAHDIVAHLR